MEQISIPVSPGELVDKITILEIKAERITDAEKLRNVRTELDLLVQAWEAASAEADEILPLKEALKEINQALWDIEDRRCAPCPHRGSQVSSSPASSTGRSRR